MALSWGSRVANPFGSSIGTAEIEDGAVTAAKVAADVATQAELDAHAALDKSTAHPGTIEAADIASDAITTIKILDGNVTAAKVAADVATQAELDAHAALTGVSNHIPATGITDAHVAAAAAIAKSKLAALAIADADVDAAAAIAWTKISKAGAAAADVGAQAAGAAAGGVLAGTYPNPSFAADMATQAELDTHAALSGLSGHVPAAGITSAEMSGSWLTNPVYQARVFATAYQPSATRPTLIIADLTVDCDKNDDGGVTLKIENANPPTVTRHTFDLLSISNDAVNTQRVRIRGCLCAVVPAGWRYQLDAVTVAGTPTMTLNNVEEVVL